MVTAPGNVELVVADLAELEPAVAGPKVNYLVVSLCAPISYRGDASL